MSDQPSHAVHRRHLMKGIVASGLGAATLPWLSSNSQAKEKEKTHKGDIQQSIAFWCFNSAGDKWSIEKTCQIAKQLHCVSVELADVSDWKVLKKHGLICAMAPNGMPGAPFIKGFNNPRYHEEVITRTKKSIDACADAGFPNVIAFTGYQWRDAEDSKSGTISREEGIANCVKGLKKIASYAEKKKVNICLEHLNTRDDTHPMKGHPGYQGDDLNEVAKIIRTVDSPNVRLLFDIYHVQVMHGDVIRRLDEQKDIIGHIHTAGNPGRGELDENQEINYPAIMRKLLSLKFKGYVGQEFIPTRDPMAGLKQAVSLCDV